jgi:hypothetical protein
VREEESWPLPRTGWRPLYLTGAGLAATPPPSAGQITFGMRTHGARWEWPVTADTELTGPMALRLWVETHGADDVDLFAGVEKWRGHRYVPFEGSYGFGRDRVTTGWLKASLRSLDEHASRPFEPVPGFRRREPLKPGQIVHRALGSRAPGSPAHTRHPLDFPERAATRPVEQNGPFGGVAGESRGAGELGPRFLVVAELGQEVAADAGQQVIVAQLGP